MAQTNINIRMDSDLKKEFEKFCSDVGMSMTTAFVVFAKATVKEQKIPFEISAKEDDPFYSKENMEELARRVANLEAGKSALKEHELIEAD